MNERLPGKPLNPEDADWRTVPMTRTFCYFACDHCGQVMRVPLGDVKKVGPPICVRCADSGGADEDGMREITAGAYRRQARRQAKLEPIELLHLLAKALRRLGDPRIKHVSADNDHTGGSLVVVCHNKAEFVIGSDDIRVVMETDEEEIGGTHLCQTETRSKNGI